MIGQLWKSVVVGAGVGAVMLGGPGPMRKRESRFFERLRPLYLV